MSTPPTRRDFLKATATTGAVLAAGGALNAHAAESDEIGVGLIGCGGRGSQAGENVVSSAKGVKIVALGDAFTEKAYELRERLVDWVKRDGKAKEYGNQVAVCPDDCYGGLDAYEKVINTPGVNYVMLATPPGFRPLHIQAVIAAGKNLFTEKPVGVDSPGIRKVLAAYEEAKKKGLYVVAG